MRSRSLAGMQGSHVEEHHAQEVNHTHTQRRRGTQETGTEMQETPDHDRDMTHIRTLNAATVWYV